MRPSLITTLALALLLGVPAAQAVEYGYGSAVGSSDYDFSPMAEAQRLALCFIDFDGDGIPLTAEEPVFLMTRVATNGVCPASLSTPSILLNTIPGRAAGSEVTLTDAWGGKTVLTLTDLHALRYMEDGSDASKLDSKDTVYLDLKNVARSTVDVGDIRLSGNGPGKAGTAVAAGDADLARPLTNIRGSLRQVHSSNMVYKASSGFYLNADAGALGGTVDGTCVAAACPVSGDFGVESGDLRLNPKAVNPLSDTATILPDHVELVQATVSPGQPFQVMVTAKNTGKAAGAGLIETSIDGLVVDGRGTPAIEAGGSAVLVLTLIAPLTPGQHIVKSGTYADFLQVSAPPATAAAAGNGTAIAPNAEGQAASVRTQGAPAGPPLAALGSLVAVGLLLRRRAA